LKAPLGNPLMSQLTPVDPVLLTIAVNIWVLFVATVAVDGLSATVTGARADKPLMVAADVPPHDARVSTMQTRTLVSTTRHKACSNEINILIISNIYLSPFRRPDFLARI
jgi:hypothetical protein